MSNILTVTDKASNQLDKIIKSAKNSAENNGIVFLDEIDIISATELQEYIDSGEIKSELVLPISSLENECQK